MLYPEDFISVIDDSTVNITVANVISNEPEEHEITMSDLKRYVLSYQNSNESIRMLGSITGEHRQMDDLSHILDEFWLALHGKDVYQELANEA